MADQDESISIRQIEPGDKLTGLSLGDELFTPLKTFLQRQAKDYHAHNLGRTYGAFQGAKVVGYITLACGEVSTDGADNPLLGGIRYNYPNYPAMKIARLAVDRRYQGFGLGISLVNLALGIAKDIVCPAIGCRFVMVDSKKSATKFYEKIGFTILDTPTNRARSEPVMFMDLYKIEEK